MITFLTQFSVNRVVLLGAQGFVASRLQNQLATAKVPFVAFSSKELDLSNFENASRLAAELKPTDSLVFISALTPDKGRDVATLQKNIAMAATVSSALEKSSCSHLT